MNKYKYTVADRMEPFKALTSRRNNNKTKDITYSLLNNNTLIKPAEKCSLCHEKTSETYMFAKCKRIQELKRI